MAITIYRLAQPQLIKTANPQDRTLAYKIMIDGKVKSEEISSGSTRTFKFDEDRIVFKVNTSENPHSRNIDTIAVVSRTIEVRRVSGLRGKEGSPMIEKEQITISQKVDSNHQFYILTQPRSIPTPDGMETEEGFELFGVVVYTES